MKRPSPIGAVTIITAIMVLCMTVFAVLAYSSGSAEFRLAQAGAQAVSDYYEADAQAAKLVAAALDGSTEQELRASVAATWDHETPATVEYDGHRLVANIPAGVRQTLHVEVEVVYNGAKQSREAHVTEWRTVADTEVGING